jgi:hypothetical protein
MLSVFGFYHAQFEAEYVTDHIHTTLACSCSYVFRSRSAGSG